MAASGDQLSNISDAASIESGDESDYSFWRQPYVVSLLNAAEKKFYETTASGSVPARSFLRKASKQTHRMRPHAATNPGVDANGNAVANKMKPRNKTGTARKTKAAKKVGRASKANIAKQQPSSTKPCAMGATALRPTTIDVEDSAQKCAAVSAALQQLTLNVGAPHSPKRPTEIAESEDAGHKPSTQAADHEEKSSKNCSAAAPNVDRRRCANCGKGEGCKIRKCALCVEEKKGPSLY